MRPWERSWPSGKEAPIEAEVCIPCRRVEFDTRCGCQPRHEKIPSLNRECPLSDAVAFQFRRINPGEPHRNMIPQHRRQERIIERYGTRVSIITMVDGDRKIV